MFAVVVIALPIPSAEPRDSVTHPFIRLVDENSLSFVHSFVILSLSARVRAQFVKKSLPISVSLEREQSRTSLSGERERKKKQRLSVAFVCLPKNRALVIEKIAEVKASSSAGGAWGEGTEENLSAGKSRAFLFPSFFSSLPTESNEYARARSIFSASHFRFGRDKGRTHNGVTLTHKRRRGG